MGNGLNSSSDLQLLQALFSGPLGTFAIVPSTSGAIITFVFHSFFSFQSRSIIFSVQSTGTEKTTKSQVHFFLKIRLGLQARTERSICIYVIENRSLMAAMNRNYCILKERGVDFDLPARSSRKFYVFHFVRQILVWAHGVCRYNDILISCDMPFSTCHTLTYILFVPVWCIHLLCD